MKKLQRVNFDESDLLNADEMLKIKAGDGWTTNDFETYVGANGDCIHSCDSYGGDVCGSDDTTTDISEHC